MIASACGAVALSAVAAQTVSPPAIALGKTQTFKDWAVGCDNGLSCQAVSLATESAPENMFALGVSRDGSVNAPLQIKMSGFVTKADRFRVVIDGRVADTGTMQVGSETITISGANAIKLARTMSKGKALRLVDGSGADLGGVSLSGIAAALRYADVEQGRVGSRGAIIATGRKMATARTVPIPVITAKKIKPSDSLPDTAALVALSERSPCASERLGSTEDTAYSLGDGGSGPQALVLLNCGAGAYNFSSGVYIGQRDTKGKWTFAPAKFDYAPPSSAGEIKTPIVVNADWDAATQSLDGYNKGRGLGDCGSSDSYVWDGSSFRLKGATRMRECRGSLEWIPIWRAEVRLVGESRM
jgi:hypothetical protein